MPASTLTIDEAREGLINRTYRRLRVKYQNRTRTIFYNPDYKQFGILIPGGRKNGTVFRDWDGLQFIYRPDKLRTDADMVRKYQKKAALATWDNSWLRDIRNADPSKSLYENHITTGCGIDGKVITVASLAKEDSYIAEQLLKAFRERREYHSYRFPFRGYECSVWTNVNAEGEVQGGLNLEYKDCANGYYYLLINEKEFIGYDID